MSCDLGKFDGLVIYRGATLSLLLELVANDEVTPINLTGLGPFTCQLRKKPEGELVAELDVAETDLANGKITLSIDHADTVNLPVCDPVWDVVDRTGHVWVEPSVGQIRKKSSVTPAP